MKIDLYFSAKKAPLAGYGNIFVNEANKYDLDWRLLPAIAMKESSGGKSKTAKYYKNPFGWGFNDNKAKNTSLIYDQDSWEDSIIKIAWWMNNSYYNNGLREPHEIVTKYNPGSVDRAGGDPYKSEWAKHIELFMSEIENQEVNTTFAFKPNVWHQLTPTEENANHDV